MVCKEEGCFGNSLKPGSVCEPLTEMACDKNGECKFKKKYRDFCKGYEPTEEEIQIVKGKAGQYAKRKQVRSSK